jgi:hypothetical protein
LTRDKVLDREAEDGAAISAQQHGAVAIGSQHTYAQAFALRATSCGITGVGFGEVEGCLAVGASGFFGIDFKRAAAIGAHMVETAFWLARIDDLAAFTVGAGDEVFQRGDHRKILACRG